LYIKKSSGLVHCTSRIYHWPAAVQWTPPWELDVPSASPLARRVGHKPRRRSSIWLRCKGKRRRNTKRRQSGGEGTTNEQTRAGINQTGILAKPLSLPQGRHNYTFGW